MSSQYSVDKLKKKCYNIEDVLGRGKGKVYMENPSYNHYEVTVTMNPKFYTLEKATRYMKSIASDVMSDFLRLSSGIGFVQYCVEYQENGMPHIHFNIIIETDIEAISLNNLKSKYTRSYGKTKIYYTGNEDKLHHNDHYHGTWSNYLNKEVNANEVNGKQHYFEYEIWKYDVMRN